MDIGLHLIDMSEIDLIQECISKCQTWQHTAREALQEKMTLEQLKQLLQQGKGMGVYMPEMRK